MGIMKRVKNNGMNGTTSPSHVLGGTDGYSEEGENAGRAVPDLEEATRADYPPEARLDSPVGPASHRGADRSTTERRQEGNCGKEPLTSGGRKKISHVG